MGQQSHQFFFFFNVLFDILF